MTAEPAGAEGRGRSGLAPTDDPLAAPFFHAAREGRLVVQRCLNCGTLRWPPLVGCPECRSRETVWADVAPRGAIWSFVVYHRAFQADLADKIPYTVALVELDDGPYMLGRVREGDKPPAIGDRVLAEFVVRDDMPLLYWNQA